MSPKLDAFAFEDKLEGRYVNYFKVGYNADVFVVDNYQMFPDNERDDGHPQSASNPKFRLITSPTDARQLLKHLKMAIDKYEGTYGEIKEQKDHQHRK